MGKQATLNSNIAPKSERPLAHHPAHLTYLEQKQTINF
ncbi:hypothetical protein BGS_0491 [Beggiatoa sp. SS]|nr:hypothetical protein BGS_0491 [Beggiatoa sp. SS]